MKLPKLAFKPILITILILLVVFLAVLSLSRKTKPPPPTPPTSSPQTSPRPPGFDLTPLTPIASPTPEQQQQLNQQTEDDINYSETLKQLYQQSPWLKKLPIETNNYRLVYDFETSSFRIRILTIPSSPEELETIKQTALNHLQSIGVDTTIQPYYFLEP
jgi:hypothetical protein